MDVSPFRRRPGRDRSGDGRMPWARHRLDRPGRFSLARSWTVTGADARRIVEWPRLRPAAWSARRRTPHRGERHRLVGDRDIYRFGALTERQGARARPCPRSGPGDGGPECPHLSDDRAAAFPYRFLRRRRAVVPEDREVGRIVVA